MWCWRRTERVNNEAVLHRVKEERNILHTIRQRKAKWIWHILRRNCLLSHVIEGKIIGTRRRGRRRKQLLDDLKEARGYWKLKEETQDRTLWRTQLGRGYGSVARRTTTWTWNLITVYQTTRSHNSIHCNSLNHCRENFTIRRMRVSNCIK
jgi:hypothetical protein